MTFQSGNPGRPAIKTNKELADVSADDTEFEAFTEQYDWDDWCRNQCPSRNDYCKTRCPRAPVSAMPCNKLSVSACSGI
jgi:hypothetical protein